MKPLSKKQKVDLYTMVALACYCISVALTPLFHLHPEKDHLNLRGDVYHSHTEPSATHTSDQSHDGDHTDASAEHFVLTIGPLVHMAGALKLNSDSRHDLVKLTPRLVLFIPARSEDCCHRPFRQLAFDRLAPESHGDYCVLSATNLSPPQA